MEYGRVSKACSRVSMECIMGVHGVYHRVSMECSRVSRECSMVFNECSRL